MQSLSYWEAWSLWWSGQKLDGLQIWGISILLLGRVGKLLQFSGGLIIILDLIGPERLKRAGESWRSFVTRSKSRKVRVEEQQTTARKLGIRAAIVGLATWSPALALIFAPLILGVLVVYFLAFLLPLGIIRLIASANVILIPFIKILTVDKNTHYLRWLAFALGVIGFNFDLLAS